MGRAHIIGLALVSAASLTACETAGWPFNDGQSSRSAIAPSQVTTIGVNAYLWRAALDTLSFAPMADVDAAGGVMVTDWYANPAQPNERAKVTVMILDQDLRADALRVSVARQVLQGAQWIDAPVTAATVQRLEEIILTRARELRQAASIN